MRFISQTGYQTAVRALVLFTLLGQGIGRAEMHAVPVPVETAKNFSTGGQYYELSVSGINTYMDQLRQSDPQAFQKLDPKLSRLNSKRLWSTVSMYGGIAAGLTMTFASALSTQPNVPLLATGVGLSIVGPLFGWILSPSRSDLLDFVNSHNRIRPNSPLSVASEEAGPAPISRVAGTVFEF